MVGSNKLILKHLLPSIVIYLKNKHLNITEIPLHPFGRSFLAVVDVKEFNTEQIQLIMFFENLGYEVKDIFIGDYFIAVLADKKMPLALSKLLQQKLGKKVFSYVYTEDPKELIKQFGKKVEFNGEAIKISIAKKFFLAMVWFLKRNYGKEFKFVFF